MGAFTYVSELYRKKQSDGELCVVGRRGGYAALFFLFCVLAAPTQSSAFVQGAGGARPPLRPIDVAGVRVHHRHGAARGFLCVRHAILTMARVLEEPGSAGRCVQKHAAHTHNLPPGSLGVL